MHIAHATPARPDEATIRIGGLPQPVTLLHVTDSHLTEVDARDPAIVDAAEQRRRTFEALSPGGIAPRTHFHQALARSRALTADAVILTGDIIDFPSAANLELVEAALAATGLPYLFTLGNHDWHFPHLVWSEETRTGLYPRFAGLTAGHPAYQARDLGGLRLVTIDNSTYQVSPEQLAFLRAELASGRPCLLFMHIPLYVPSLAPTVVAKFAAPIMLAAPGWTAETQDAWHVHDAEASTQACYELLTEGAVENLVGIFCGHVHFAHVDAFGEGRMQYVTRPGFEGGYRVIRLLPG